MYKRILTYFIFNCINTICLFKIDATNPIIIKYIIIIVLSYLFFSKISFNIANSFSSFFILIYIYASHSIILLIPDLSNKMSLIVQQSQFDFSLTLYILYFSIFIIHRKITNKNYNNYNFNKKNMFIKSPIKNKYIYLFFISIFIATLITYSLGISRMGQASRELPFKLGGFLNYYRSIIIPVIFAVIVYRNYYFKSKKTILIYIVIMLIWVFLDSFVKLSRSTIIEYFVPLFQILIFTSVLSLKSTLKYLIPIIIIAFILFPVITALRNHDGNINFNAIREVSSDNVSKNETFTTTYKRLFSNAYYYEKYIPYINNDIFDFSNLRRIASIGGSHYFTTYVIDDLWGIEGHNSGSTGICDALLIGGRGFAYFSFILSTIFALYIDSNKLRQKPLNRITLFYFLRWTVQWRFWSLFFDVAQFSLFIVFITIYYINNYNSKQQSFKISI